MAGTSASSPMRLPPSSRRRFSLSTVSLLLKQNVQLISNYLSFFCRHYTSHAHPPLSECQPLFRHSPLDAGVQRRLRAVISHQLPNFGGRRRGLGFGTGLSRRRCLICGGGRVEVDSRSAAGEYRRLYTVQSAGRHGV